MATIVPNLFTSWNMTEDELFNAQILTTPQIQHIQSLIAEYAQEKINVLFDPANPVAFAQREAELKGNIESLQFLLQLSEAAVEARNSHSN